VQNWDSYPPAVLATLNVTITCIRNDKTNNNKKSHIRGQLSFNLLEIMAETAFILKPVILQFQLSHENGQI
jgi:hypothetical protein